MNLSSASRSVRKILATALVTVVTATGLVAVAPSGASARTALPAYSANVYEQQVQYFVNVQRRAHHLAPLSMAGCTDSVAERWSAYLAAHDAFYHQSMTRLLDKCDAYYAGETLGRGAITPQTLVSMWMHSPPHRAVLLSKSPRRIGIGATPNARGEWVVAANFMRF
jgi:uncharacterized protein YkwD